MNYPKAATPRTRRSLKTMGRFDSYIRSATEILTRYTGGEPFANYLKRFFAEHKKYGSADRKQIGHLCYSYFRTGRLFEDKPMEERILAGLFLCSEQPGEVLQQLKPDWNDRVPVGVEEKLSLLGVTSIDPVFPFSVPLSDGIDRKEFVLSHLEQKDVFLRIRPGHHDLVVAKLAAAHIPFREISPDCLSVSSASKIDQVLLVNREVVIQDRSSQLTLDILTSSGPASATRLRIWDCCAASGGKSILAWDRIPRIELTVSDVRESILVNLRKRFAEAGISRYHSFVADLTQSSIPSQCRDMDIIICDVPCSGSGTWGRTPEQLRYFRLEQLTYYTELQEKITSHVLPPLKPGGYFLYITCSVFRQENEDRVTTLTNAHQLQVIHSAVIKGYAMKADTMFAALLRKPS